MAAAPLFILLCSLAIVDHFYSSSVLAADTLTQGDPSINSSQILLSRNGFFTLGFQRLSNSSSSSTTGLTATLEDTGNFSLSSGGGNTGRQAALWQSFDFPTDSWLPGMKLGRGSGRNRTLTSWLTDSIPAPGAFTLEWDPAAAGAPQMVVKRRGNVFWTSGRQLRGDVFENEDYLTYTASGAERNFSIWRLRHNGYIVDRATSRVILNADSCDGNSTANGCLRWDGPDCRRRDGGSRMVLRRGGWVNTVRKREDNNASLGISDCKDLCWRDCECVGTTIGNSNGSGCSFWFGNFSQDPNSNSVQYYVIVDLNSDAIAEERNWIWALIAVAVVLSTVIVGILWTLRRRKLKERLFAELMASDAPNDMGELEDDGGGGGDHGHNLKIYSITTIMGATDNFSLQNKLGQGGFGPVFKGKLAEGREVAVKRLSRSSGQGLVEFRNELILIAKLQHTNLVRLLGCCIHGEEKMLVYEYMPNKSLDSFIFGEFVVLHYWNKRFSIIEGIAQGLLYLHKYSRVRIIHRDMKASNILLDENLNPKISDFGMARIFNTNALEANTNRVVGTYGYMSPEYAMEGTFSIKSDVFSFGVLLLEIVSGRKNHGLVHHDPPINLVGYTWELWKEGMPLQLMDPTLEDSCDKNQILRCINVGLLCIEYNAEDRPTMSGVISLLTSEVIQLPTPKQPAFTAARPRSMNIDIGSNTGSSNLDSCSTNNVTVTTMSGR
ncbi:G-type lectin S-receptor-like serine/threonine-protein kinase CES101 [Linum grandiflorum]